MKRKSCTEYGKLKTDMSDIRDIRTYHDLFKEDTCLDEAECMDLDLDDLFEFSDRCITPVGEMLLYSKLRHMRQDPHADERDFIAEKIDSSNTFRVDVEDSLSGLSGDKGSSVRHLLGMNVSLSGYHKFLFLLLAAPDLHDDAVGQMLGGKHLGTDGEAADRDVLPFLHIPHGSRYNLLGGIVAIVIGDGIVHHRAVKEIGLDPTGADRHDADAATLLFELLAEGAGEAQHKGL